jgi:hypothetical protein
MVRILVKTDNAGMAANCGGSVLSTFESFDVDNPALEAALRITDITEKMGYTHAQVIGAELLPASSAISH